VCGHEKTNGMRTPPPISSMGQRCKSADPSAMGVSALNEDDQDADAYVSETDRHAQGDVRPGTGFGGSHHRDGYSNGGGPSLDMDRLTLPHGMHRGGAQGDVMADQPVSGGSHSMLQPMSPGQPHADIGAFGQV
jgi:hypothetical protein